MLLRVLATASMIIAASSSAQTVNTTAVKPLGGGAHDGGLGYIGRTGSWTEDKQCLINKHTGQRVCKTRSGWRAEAARLQRQDQPRPVQN